MYSYEQKGLELFVNIALIYPSDYLYTFALEFDNDCFLSGSVCSMSADKESSWLRSQTKRWAFGTSGDLKISIEATGRVYNNSSTASFRIIPTLYLNSKVKITSGDGTIDNAYKLSM